MSNSTDTEIRQPSAPSAPRAWVCDVTPELAGTWLTLNHTNRNMRPQRVDHFMKLIRDDQWLMTGEAVQFEGTLDGGTAVLLNGQHRLAAIARGDRPVPVLIVEGVDPGARVYIDTGAPRRFADVLRMERGATDAATTASTVRLGWTVETGRADDAIAGKGVVRTAPSNGDLLTWYDSNAAALSDALTWGSRGRREIRGNTPALTIARMRFSELDVTEADDYFDDLYGGVGLREGDPVLAMRNWHINRAAMGRSARTVPAVYHLALLIKAWNYRRTGTPIKVMTFRPFGATGGRGGGGERFPSAA